MSVLFWTLLDHNSSVCVQVIAEHRVSLQHCQDTTFLSWNNKHCFLSRIPKTLWNNGLSVELLVPPWTSLSSVILYLALAAGARFCGDTVGLPLPLTWGSPLAPVYFCSHVSHPEIKVFLFPVERREMSWFSEHRGVFVRIQSWRLLDQIQKKNNLMW